MRLRRTTSRTVTALLAGAVTASLLGAGPAEARPVGRDFPVKAPTSYSRYHHDYPATDIFARCGAPVVAVARGRVLEVSRRDRWDPSTDKGSQRGGKFVSVAGADGVRYYGSHLRRVARGLSAGDHVHRGQRLGRVGHTGSARYVDCHLHFGLSPVCAGTGDWRVRRGVVHPYRFLRSWEDGGNRSPKRAVTRWKRRHGC